MLKYIYLSGFSFPRSTPPATLGNQKGPQLFEVRDSRKCFRDTTATLLLGSCSVVWGTGGGCPGGSRQDLYHRERRGLLPKHYVAPLAQPSSSRAWWWWLWLSTALLRLALSLPCSFQRTACGWAPSPHHAGNSELLPHKAGSGKEHLCSLCTTCCRNQVSPPTWWGNRYQKSNKKPTRLPCKKKQNPWDEIACSRASETLNSCSQL